MISGSISSSICYAPNHDRISLSPYLQRKRVNKRFLLGWDEVELDRAWTGFWRRTINAIPSPTVVSRLCKGENTRRYPRWSVFRNNEANGRRSNFETGKRRGTRPSVLESVGNASSWWSRIIEGRWLRLVNSQHKYPSAISFVGVHYGGLNARTCTVYYPDKFGDAIRLLPLFDVSRWTLFLSRSIRFSFRLLLVLTLRRSWRLERKYISHISRCFTIGTIELKIDRYKCSYILFLSRVIGRCKCYNG